MKKMFHIVMLAFIIIGMMPIALADNHESGASGSASTDDVDVEVGEDSVSVSTDDVDVTVDESGVSVRGNTGRPLPRATQAGGQPEGNTPRPTLISANQQLRERVKNFAKEDFREFQREKLMTAVQNCQELENSAQCEEKLQKRVELVKKLGERDLERLQKIEQRKLENKEKLEELRNSEEFEKFKGEALKARELAQQKKSQAKEKLDKAKENYREKKQKFDDNKGKLEQARNQLEECDGDACEEVKNQVRAHSKEMLLNSLDVAIEHLEKLRASVESSEQLTEEEADEALADIDEQAAQIEEAKASVEALGNDATGEEIAEAAQQARSAIRNTIQSAKQNAAFVANSRIGGIIVKSKQMQLKLDRVLARAVEEGYDTAELQSDIDSFDAKIEEAKVSYESAVSAFEEAKNEDGSVEDAQRYMQDAHTKLREANVILKDIFREIKGLDLEEELEDSSEDEALEEAEEELEEETSDDESSDEESDSSDDEESDDTTSNDETTSS